MAIKDVDTKCYILALFIRNDGARFLLGSGAYEFKEGQQHFAANTMQNDVVEVQGNDGYLLAGQVRRPGVQSFDGYVGDSSTSKPMVEGLRRDFFQFFRKGYFYKVVYVFPDGSAIQRKRGFLVDAPVVQELYQIYPEYHVALNFEDINYYFYDENDAGEEIYGKSAIVGLSMASGGLVWDNDGAVTDPLVFGGVVTVKGAETINNLLNVAVPLVSVGLHGDTYQQTYSGKNKINLTNGGDHGVTGSNNNDGTVTISGTADATGGFSVMTTNTTIEAGTYTLCLSKTLPFLVNLSVASGVSFRIPSGSRTATTTLTQSYSSSVSLFISMSSGTTYNETFGIQLVAGSDPDYDFEPYIGGTASPNPDYPQEVQTVTGEQTVTVTGKNLFDKNNVNQFMGYFDGGADNPILVEGVTTRNRVIYIKCKPSTTYSISLTTRDGINSPQVGTTDSRPVTGLAVTKLGDFASGSLKLENLTTSATAKYIAIRFQTQDPTVQFDNISQALLAGLQIEQSSTTTSFEPYHGQSYTVDLRGTNLLDLSSLIIGYVSSNGTFSTNQTQAEMRSSFIKVQPNTTYTFSIQETTDTYPTWFGVGLYGDSNTGSFIRRDTNTTTTATSITFTTSATTNYVVVSARNMANATKAQVEEGPSATAYQQYNPIELCKIGDYQDYIYKSGDDWYLHKAVGKVVLDGTEYWGYSSGTGRERLYHTVSDIHLQDFVSDAPVVAMTDYFRPSNWYNIYYKTAGDNTISSHNSDHTIIIHSSKFTDANSFKTWLTNNNMTVYYALATPTDTPITDTTLIGQLDALGAAKLYVGENNLMVTASGTNLPAELEVGYYTEIEDGYGFVWEEGRSPSNIIAVDSIDDVFPVLTITGETENPILTNVTTGTIFQYNGTITASQTLVIDMMNQTATLNGTSVIGNVTGDWVYFAPGNNRVSYTAGNANAPDATIEWQEIVG